MKINKKVFYLILIILIIILALFIYKKVIKNSKIGNNMSSQEMGVLKK